VGAAAARGAQSSEREEEGAGADAIKEIREKENRISKSDDSDEEEEDAVHEELENKLREHSKMSEVAEATPLLTQNSESFISSTRLILLFGVSTFLGLLFLLACFCCRLDKTREVAAAVKQESFGG
jgi:hypothetical protein